ncbi:hypothetical protein [Acrocarpospora catenulata]|uniref:hypothetical protein n=1 Tax=Acrocarpospora catenulata TaxID=2836182 RepID=UPI001BD9B8E2|nr:hypothetical protein [Acrocarpospora catenulata]
MSRSGKLAQAAAVFEQADLGRSHEEYRRYLEAVRTIMCDLSLLIAEDAAEAGRWLRERDPKGGRVGWWDRMFLSFRLSGHGKRSAEAVLEAAKTAVRMSMVHQEYIALETDPAQNGKSGRQGRYRTEK